MSKTNTTLKVTTITFVLVMAAFVSMSIAAQNGRMMNQNHTTTPQQCQRVNQCQNGSGNQGSMMNQRGNGMMNQQGTQRCQRYANCQNGQQQGQMMNQGNGTNQNTLMNQGNSINN